MCISHREIGREWGDGVVEYIAYAHVTFEALVILILILIILFIVLSGSAEVEYF